MRARLHHRGHRLGFFREATHDVCDAAADAAAAAGDLRRARSPGRRHAFARPRRGARDRDGGERRRVRTRDLGRAWQRVWIPARSSLLARDGRHHRGWSRRSERSATRTSPIRSRSRGVRRWRLRRHVHRSSKAIAICCGTSSRMSFEQVPAEGELIDLYAGVGLFSVCAAVARGVRTTAVEGDRVAASDLAFNAAASGVDVTAVCRPVEEFVSRFDGATARGLPPSTVIVDPPRTGLSPAALAGLLQRAHGASSTCPATSRRSRATRGRSSRPATRFDRADAFDLFPNTPHVETVVVFDLAGC